MCLLSLRSLIVLTFKWSAPSDTAQIYPGTHSCYGLLENAGPHERPVSCPWNSGPCPGKPPVVIYSCHLTPNACFFMLLLGEREHVNSVSLKCNWCNT